jgi:hypothetical protein
MIKLSELTRQALRLGVRIDPAGVYYLDQILPRGSLLKSMARSGDATVSKSSSLSMRSALSALARPVPRKVAPRFDRIDE